MNLEIVEQFEEFDELRDVDVSFSQMVLKQNFELIIKVLRSHRLNINKLANGLQDFQKHMPSLSLFDNFKEQLENHSDRIEILEQNQGLNDKFDKLEQMQQELEKNQTEFQQKQNDFEKKLEELQNKDNAQQDQIDRLNEELKKYSDLDFLGELDKLKQQFNDFEEKQKLMNELRNSGDSGDNKNISSDIIIELQAQLNKVKTNINEINEKCDQFAMKSELEEAKQNMQEQINELDEKIRNLEDDLHTNYVLFIFNFYVNKLKALKKDLQDLEIQFHNLRDTYLMDKFNEIETTSDNVVSDVSGIKLQIQQVYEIINSLNKDSGIKEIQIPIIQPAPQIDNTKLKNLEAKIRELEKQALEMNGKIKENTTMVRSLKEDMKTNLEKLQEEKMDKTEDKTQMLLDQLNSLRDRINTINNQLQSTDFLAKQNADDIKQIFEKLFQKKSQIQQTAQQREPQLTEAQISDLIKTQTDKLTDDLMKLIQEIMKDLADKATKDELQRHEDMMKKIIEEILAQLKTLADKSETKKSFVYLEKKINEIYQLAMQDKNNKECDGLLAKKQLGWSCASCDKDLDKYRGQLGDFINWAVFPRKETSPIYAMHYANEIAKKTHEAAYKNFENPGQEFDPNLKAKPNSQTDFQPYSQMSTNYVPQMFKPSNTMYTLKPVNTKINFNNNAKDNKTIHMVHNQLGFMKNLKKDSRSSKRSSDKNCIQQRSEEYQQ